MSAPGAIKNIAWVGNVFYQPHLRRLGFDCRRIPLPGPEALTWNDVCERSGFEPQVVVYADTSLSPPLVGLEGWPSLNVFYAIDTHLHSWYPFYAQAFDLACVSLKGHLWRFEARLQGRQLMWMPPAAQDAHQPDFDAEKEWDLLFAGNVSKATTPKRHDFLEELRARIPGLAVRRGKFQELFPKARLSLNIAEKGDLNFRVFEALACGACLLTPWVKHGFGELFENGRHLFTYAPHKMDDLARLVENLLANPQRIERVARAGNELVEREHRFINRALALSDRLAELPVADIIAARQDMQDLIRNTFLKETLLHFADQYKELELGRRYLAAATGKGL